MQPETSEPEDPPEPNRAATRIPQAAWKLSAYLSLVNATNHQNVEGLTYNFDYTEQGSVNGVPVLPIFGAKGEW